MAEESAALVGVWVPKKGFAVTDENISRVLTPTVGIQITEEIVSVNRDSEKGFNKRRSNSGKAVAGWVPVTRITMAPGFALFNFASEFVTFHFRHIEVHQKQIETTSVNVT